MVLNYQTSYIKIMKLFDFSTDINCRGNRHNNSNYNMGTLIITQQSPHFEESSRRIGQPRW